MEVSFRTKVLGVVVPALLVLLVLGAVVVGRSLDDSTAARADRRAVNVGRAAMSLRDEIQNESRYAVLVLNFADGRGKKELDDQMAVTDEAVAELSALLAPRSTTASVSTEQVVDVMTRQLPDLRSLISPGAGDTVIGGLVDGYDNIIVDLSTLTVEFAGSATNGLLSQRASELIEIVGAKDAYGRQLLTPLLRLNGSEVGPADGARYVDAADAAKRSFDRVASIARPDVATALGEFLTSKLAGDVERQGEVFATAGKIGQVPRLNGPDWLALTNGAATGLDQIEDALFNDFVDLAAQVDRDARRQAIFYAGLTGLGLLAAASGAYFVGRNLSRRLSNVTKAAHSIAVDRLPEILAALRNPTAESVAAAVPEIQAEGEDEVGQLANDFNVVLRTAIETSIEHSQRRAETLTNLLVNLGRRNQALIDRQLELVDQLESDQPDQRTLAGLFKLDHMITRQRRNAESLLVLAGSRRSRSWTDSLPMSDVLQGAISEVAQMDRVALEIQPGNDLTFGGVHAVDLSHLVAELVENATAYSSPTTRVTVRVQRNTAQFRIWIIDSGVGMTDEEVEAANSRVTSPPDIDEVTTDQVGFQVVGRLAQRIGARIKLQNNPAGGVAVSIDLPMSLFEVMGEETALRRRSTAAASAAMPAGEKTSLEVPDLSWAEQAFEMRDPLPASVDQLEASIPDDADAHAIIDVPATLRPAGGAELPRRERQAPVLVERSVRQLLPNARPNGPSSGPRTDIAAAMITPSTTPVRPAPLAREPARAAPAPARRSASPTPGRQAASASDAEPLVRRQTRSGAAPAAAAAAEGLFRRLPAAATTDDDAALQRRRNLSQFTRAVDLAREEPSDDPQGDHL